MRIFAVPAALLLGCCLYLPLPRAADGISRALSALYHAVLRLFTRKSGKTDDQPAQIAYFLLLFGVALLLSGIHPIVAALLMAPAFTGLAVLPGCAKTKDELDSGAYARDIPAYEALVRSSVASLAPAFVQGVCAPMLLCAAGMPLHAGAPMAALYLALGALSPALPAAARAAAAIHRVAERVFCAFMLLCAGVVGRNPLHTGGKGAQARLMSILGVAGDDTDTHAPMAGDIPQGIFLCAFASALLCFTLTAVGFTLCR